MIVFIPFQIEHLRSIQVQPKQRADLDATPLSDLAAMAAGREAWAAVEVGTGHCYGAAGVIDVPRSPHRGHAWAILGDDIGPHMRQVVRFGRAVLDRYPRRRVEMTVECDWPQGERFARMLGFALEAPRMVGYANHGSDMQLWARLRW
jgi:hypothetical protein